MNGTMPPYPSGEAPSSDDDEESLKLDDIMSARPALGPPPPASAGGKSDPHAVDLGQSMLRLFRPLGLGDAGVAPDCDSDNDEEEGWQDSANRRLMAILAKVTRMRAEHEEEVRRHFLETEDLRRENAMLRERLDAALNGGVGADPPEPARLVADSVVAAAAEAAGRGAGDDSPGVRELRMQLAEAQRRVGALTRQVEVLQSQADARAEALRAQLMDQSHESFRAEMGHAEDMMRLEREVERLRLENEDSHLSSVAELEFQLEMERSMKLDALSFAKKGRRVGGGGFDGDGDEEHRRRESEITCVVSNKSKGQVGPSEREGGQRADDRDPDRPPHELFLRRMSIEDDENSDLDAAPEGDDIRREIQANTELIKSLGDELDEQDRVISDLNNGEEKSSQKEQSCS